MKVGEVKRELAEVPDDHDFVTEICEVKGRKYIGIYTAPHRPPTRKKIGKE